MVGVLTLAYGFVCHSCSLVESWTPGFFRHEYGGCEIGWVGAWVGVSIVVGLVYVGWYKRSGTNSQRRERELIFVPQQQRFVLLITHVPVSCVAAIIVQHHFIFIRTLYHGYSSTILYLPGSCVITC